MLFLDMDDAQRSALVRRTLDPTDPKTKMRRAAIADRVACVEERPEVLAAARIRQIFLDPKIAEHVVKFCSPVWNPLLDICTRIAQGYAHPPIRRLPASDEATAALLTFLEGPTRFTTRAKRWNLLSVALSTVIVLVLPKKRKNKACFDFRTIHGATSEVVQDESAPFGDTPSMLAYCLRRPEERYQTKDGQAAELVCVVDEYAYHYCLGNGTIKRSEPHGVGRFPGAVLRSVDPEGSDGDDWWAWRNNHTLVGGTASVGAIGALCEHMRKTQGGKLITVSRTTDDAVGDDEPLAEEGQTIGPPETVFEVLNGEVKVEDFEASIDGYLKHQAAILHESARRTTGSSRILDDQLLSPDELAQRHAVLLGLQRDQHGFLGPFEADLLEVMAAIAAVYDVEGFPTLAQLEGYEATFVPLTYIATPEARLDYYVAATKYGVSDQVMYLQELGWSEGDARSLLKRIAKRRAELHAIQAKRNSPADPTDDPMGDPTDEEQVMVGRRPEAITGRTGGIASGAARR